MEIEREKLRGTYSEAFIKSICMKISANGNFLSFARRFIYDEDKQVVRNALAALTKATNSEIEQLRPAMDELIELAIKTNNPSIRRLLLSIICRIGMREDNIHTDFLDFCLTKMTNPTEVPSVQSLCMKLSYQMCRFFPELMEEMRCILEDMEISFYTPAVKSVRKRILMGTLK